MIVIKHRFTGAVLCEFEAPHIKACAELGKADLYGADLYGANLYGANLSGANLYGANLRGADLSGADLRGANLREADLYGANLYGANLSGANLYGANLRGANLRGANLYGANLRGANLRGADLYGANLRGADLSGADLSGANSLILAQTQICPEEGAFVGWKKLANGAIARLVIPHDAARLNAYSSRKCRASKAVVHEIFGADNGMDKHTGNLRYAAGTEVAPDKFDDDRRIECSHGIHFFITRAEAEAY